MEKVDKCLGFGGVGDCFIVSLKLLEYNEPFTYTHIDISHPRLILSKKLLNKFGVQCNCLKVDNIKYWWRDNSSTYDKCFNVFAKGYIDIPIRPYHWQPCTDEGYHNPFAQIIPIKTDHVAVQVNSGGNRTYKEKPIVEYVLDNYNESQILWFGTDTDFKSDYGINYCGKLDFMSALSRMASCRYFVGFPSILLYHALYTKAQCYVFTDHQGRDDLRIHDQWKGYLSYDK